MSFTVGLSGRKQSGKDAIADYCEARLALEGYRIEKIGFATELKRQCHALFGIPYALLCGSDEEKNMLTYIYWETMPFLHMKKGRMTVREVLQSWGTNIVRCISPDAWVSAFANLVYQSSADVIFCTDVRFPNEVEMIHALGGKVIRLSRSVHSDNHASESQLDRDKFDWNTFDAVIHNGAMSLEESQRVALGYVEDFLRESEGLHG